MNEPPESGSIYLGEIAHAVMSTAPLLARCVLVRISDDLHKVHATSFCLLLNLSILFVGSQEKQNISRTIRNSSCQQRRASSEGSRINLREATRH